MQAPWRLQLRSVGGTMLWLIVLVVIAGLYLGVNSKMANAGREIMNMEAGRAVLQRENAELYTRLAGLTSPQHMLERALAMGFRPARPDEIEYVVVEGYDGVPPFVAPRPSGSSKEGRGSLSPAYTETLGDWLSRILAGGEES